MYLTKKSNGLVGECKADDFMIMGETSLTCGRGAFWELACPKPRRRDGVFWRPEYLFAPSGCLHGLCRFNVCD